MHKKTKKGKKKKKFLKLNNFLDVGGCRHKL